MDIRAGYKYFNISDINSVAREMANSLTTFVHGNIGTLPSEPHGVASLMPHKIKEGDDHQQQ
jgi:hypothetical protein